MQSSDYINNNNNSFNQTGKKIPNIESENLKIFKSPQKINTL